MPEPGSGLARHNDCYQRKESEHDPAYDEGEHHPESLQTQAESM